MKYSNNSAEKHPSAREAAYLKAQPCPHCGEKVLKTRMDRHMKRVHPDIPHEVRARVSKPVPPGLSVCPECGVFLKPGRIMSHAKKMHSSEAVAKAQEQLTLWNESVRVEKERAHLDMLERSKPEGERILAALKNGERPKAMNVMRCDVCQSRVVFLDMGKHRSKSFDVDSMGNILGTHACEAEVRGESVRTLSGGAVDSNRRKH